MNTEVGRMAPLGDEFAKRLIDLEVGDHIFKHGEVVRIVGKVGTYRVHKIGTKFITLQVLPVTAAGGER